MGGKARAVVSWSSGKDAAWALHLARESGVEVQGIFTTLAAPGRVAVHRVPEELLDRQAAALGLPCEKVPLPWPCPNAVYEAEVGRVLRGAKRRGATHVVFGDLFLEDLRAWREARLSELGLSGFFPLWGRDTTVLAREMLAAGLEATLACVDSAKLATSFAGRTWDAALLADLPAGVDPCGENGEFHTFASAGPMFRTPIDVDVSGVVEHHGFAFAELVPAAAAPGRPPKAPR
jgi:uncharacterized protein (TIGR00290 family)